MRKRIVFLIVLIVGLTISAGIKISPATFVVQNLQPGEVVDIYQNYGHIIRIFGARTDVTYQFEPVKPSESNTKITGYVDIPDASWFWTELDSVFVEGVETRVAENPCYIKIPGGDEWYNRNYLVGVNVSPVIREGMGSLVLGAFLQFRFETAPKADVVPTKFERGEYVFVPSVIDLGHIERKKEYINKVDIYTGFSHAHKFTLSSLDPESPVARYTILTSPGHRRISDKSWVFYDEEYTIRGNQTAYISVYIPDRTPQGRYEELIFLEGREGNAFLRVRFLIKD